MCRKKFNAKKIFFNKLIGLQTLKMCLKKFDVEKICFNKLTGLLT